ncbi:MAG: hypothetical protein DVB25_08765 [Verrucomicrobia bacterium]|nr:MAG: hypothetical protein DVB25_08765 [Verrucomicrobiota bacterium]
MNAISQRLIPVLLATCALAPAQTATYTNFIRQVQLPSAVQWDATVAATGSQLSALAINPGGARFELWTVMSSPLTSYLLDTRYVGAYVPQATLVVRSEDPYSTIPRTRADRPFYVDVSMAGLLNGATDPAASKSVTLMHYVQSYGSGGTGVNLDRTQASLLTQASIATNGLQTLTYTVNAVPGAVRTKVRGEERFSVFSLVDYQAPASQLASQFIQIWPVADASIAGITQGMLIRFTMPLLTLTLNDLYPNSTTYAQVYKGNPALGTLGAVVPGSALVTSDSVPQSRVLTVQNYDSVFPDDGHWTMELLTVTPFGTDRLAYVSFDIQRIVTVNTNFSTAE